MCRGKCRGVAGGSVGKRVVVGDRVSKTGERSGKRGRVSRWECLQVEGEVAWSGGQARVEGECRAGCCGVAGESI